MRGGWIDVEGLIIMTTHLTRERERERERERGLVMKIEKLTEFENDLNYF